MTRFLPWILIIVIGTFFVLIGVINLTGESGSDTRMVLNMANTVDPIIYKMMRDITGVKDIYSGGETALGVQLVYKREPIRPEEHGGRGCVGGIMNNYYARVHEWGYDENSKLWYRPIKDVPLDAHSCISEEDVLIPYFDKKLQNAKIGEKYYP